MHFRLLFLAACLLVALPVARAQITVSFNSNYPDIPGDTQPRTYSWSDPRNWGGNIPGPLDHVMMSQYSSLESAFTVGAFTLTTASVYGEGGSLEVLGNFTANTSDGGIVFFNALTLRGNSTIGGDAPANTSVGFYRNLDNYGHLVLAGTHHAPLGMIGYYGGEPTFTNRTGATLAFSTGTISGAYSRFINEAGATITKIGSADASITFSNEAGLPGFDNHGTLAVQSGKLTVSGANNWDGGNVSLSNNAHLFFNFALPTGEINFDGTGRISTLGYGNDGNTTMKFGPNSQITLGSFGLYNINNLTFDGPVKLQNLYLPGPGLVTFRGTPTLDLTTPDTLGSYASHIDSDIRNEGTLNILGTDANSALSNLGTQHTFTNATGARVNLIGRVLLAGNNVFVNEAGATLAHDGNGPSQISWTFDNAGAIFAAGGTLEFSDARAWSTGSTVDLANGGRLLFSEKIPSGIVTLTGEGRVTLANAVQTDDLSLTAAAGSALTVRLFNATLADAKRLKFEGPISLWGTVIDQTYTPGAENSPTLELGNGVSLTRSADDGQFIINATVHSSGSVQLDSLIDYHYIGGLDWINTGVLTKIGAYEYGIRSHFYNQGSILVEEGILNLLGNTTWNGGSASIATGAMLMLPSLPFAGTFSGTGGLGFNTSSAIQVDDDVTLPFASGSRLTLYGGNFIGNSRLTVPVDVDFVGIAFNLPGAGLRLLGDTHWGPRTGDTLLDGSNFISGAVENRADASLRGALVSGWIPSVGTVDSITWHNLNGSTFTVSGAAASTGLLTQSINSAPGDRAALNNQTGATFIAGFGGARVDWTFNNQGTARAINGETLTVTNGGNWRGGRVELFQSYLNFRNTLPSGDFSVVGAGDIGFGAETLRSSGDYARAAVIVPDAGTTIRNVANASGTLLDLGLYGDLTGPGRLTLYGDKLGLEPVYHSPRGGFVPLPQPPYGNGPDLISWQNLGGVEVRGHLTLDHKSLFVSEGLDIHGTLSVNDSSLYGAPANFADPFTTSGKIQVQAGGHLAITGNSEVSSWSSTSDHPGYLFTRAGGLVSVQNSDALIGTYFANQGTLRIENSNVTITHGDNWAGGRVEFTGNTYTGHNTLTFSRLAPSVGTFRGSGSVIFGEATRAPLALDGHSYHFESIEGERPVIYFGNTSFAGPSSRLQLSGIAGLTSLILNTSRAIGGVVELSGDFYLLSTPDYADNFVIAGANVDNYGKLTALSGPPGTPSNIIASASDFTFRNREGATVDLRFGADLGEPAGGSIGVLQFINEAGARFIASHRGAFTGGSDIEWDFINRGEVIARENARLRFTGNLVNEVTGTFHVESGGQIDFGDNAITLGNHFTSDGGRIQAQQVVVDHSVAPTTTGLTIQAGSVTLANNATLNVGTGTLELLAPINGSGTLQAGTVSFVGGGTLQSTAPGSIVVDGNLVFGNSTTVNLGAGSAVRVVDGSLTGTGTLRAGQIFISGDGGGVTTAGGTVSVISDGVQFVTGDSILNFGTSTVNLAAPLNGSGAVVANNLVFDSGGSVITTTPGTLRIDSNLTLANNTTVNFGSGSTITVVDGSLTGTGSVQAGSIIFSGESGATTAGGTLQITAGDVTLQNGATVSFGTSSVTAVTPFSGTGTIIAGSVMWNGGNFVSVGTTDLTLDATVRVLNNASVNFGSAADITILDGLGGTGSLVADSFIVSGNITPGSSPGTLALIGDTTFNANSVFTFELGRPAQDLITVDGNLTLDGTINFTALPTFLAGSYALFTFTGDLTDRSLNLGTVPTGFSATLFTDLAHDLVGVNFTAVSAIPEPSTYAAIFGALVLGYAIHRRRRHRSA